MVSPMDMPVSTRTPGPVGAENAVSVLYFHPWEFDADQPIPADAGAVVVARSVATDDTLKYLRVYPSGEAYAPVTGFASFVFSICAFLYLTNFNDQVVASIVAGAFCATVVVEPDPTRTPIVVAPSATAAESVSPCLAPGHELSW